MENETKGKNNDVSIKIGGNVYGSVVGKNSGTVTSNVPIQIGREELRQLMDDIKMAKKIISNLDEITEFQKTHLSDLFNETG